MTALKLLFTTDFGLFSVAVIAATLGMGAFFVRHFLKNIDEDTKRLQGAKR